MTKTQKKINLIKEILNKKPGLRVPQIVREMLLRDESVFKDIKSPLTNNIWGMLEKITEGHTSYKGVPIFDKDAESRFFVHKNYTTPVGFKSDYEAGVGNTKKGKKIVITKRDENLSAEHEKMKKVIAEYAKFHELPFKAEEPIGKYRIDIFYRKDDIKEIFIGEIKSYKNGFYGGVGQLLMYKLLISKKFPDYKISSGYISKEKLDTNQINLLKKMQIHHIKVKSEISKIWSS